MAGGGCRAGGGRCAGCAGRRGGGDDFVGGDIVATATAVVSGPVQNEDGGTKDGAESDEYGDDLTRLHGLMVEREQRRVGAPSICVRVPRYVEGDRTVYSTVLSAGVLAGGVFLEPAKAEVVMWLVAD